jgi:hypothetical protein
MWKYILSLVSMIAVYFIHTYGMKGAYVEFWWLDVLSHGLVCFAIAVFFGALICSKAPGFKYKKTLIVILTFIIGILWEWLEIYYNITGHTLWSELYIQDTLQDFVMDTVGAVLGALISSSVSTKKFDVDHAMRSIKVTTS